MRPGVWANVSQMLRPRPSAVTAPSTWYDAVAVPQRKPGGKSFLFVIVAPSCVSPALLDPSAAPPRVPPGVSAGPGLLDDVRRGPRQHDGCLGAVGNGDVDGHLVALDAPVHLDAAE